ncbi:MAG: DUF1634 domain-containing protein [Nitrososphaeria archaeon]
MDFNDAIAYALRGGVILSAALLLLGLALLVINGRSGQYTVSQIASTASLVNSSYFNARAIITGVQTMNPVSIMFLGLVVLIATPIVRVVLGIAQFMKEKDWLYTAITLIVFFNLIFAIFILPSVLHL